MDIEKLEVTVSIILSEFVVRSKSERTREFANNVTT